MKMRWGLLERGFALAGFPLICQLVFIALLFHLINSTQALQMLESNTRQLILQAQRLLHDSYETATGMSLATSANKPDDKTMDKSVENLRNDFAQFKQSAESYPDIKKNVSDLGVTVNELIQLSRWLSGSHLKVEKHELNVTRDKRMLEITSGFLDNLFTVVNAAEIDRAAMVKEIKRLQSQFATLLVFGIPGSILVSLFLSYLYSSTISGPIKRIQANSRKFAQHGELAKFSSVVGNDEMSQFERRLYRVTECVVESQAGERALMDNALDLICSLDKEGKILQVNRAGNIVLGLSPENVVGQYIVDFLAIDDKMRADSFFRAVRETTSKIELKFRPEPETEIETSWSCFLAADTGTVFCVVQNITEQRAIERFRLRLTEVMSQSLREPLSSMRNSLNSVCLDKLGSLSPEAQRQTLMAAKNVDRLVQFVDAVLELQNLSSGHLPLILVEHDLGAIIDESLALIAASAAAKNISIARSPGNWRLICDSQKISQVLVNLVSNSIRYTPSAGTIFLSVHELGDKLEVVIRDGGPGIPEEHRKRIFKPFEQLRDAKKDGAEGEAEGAGLGLSICKLIVEAHQGRIGVREIPGSTADDNGSEFWFDIPKRPDVKIG